MKSHLILFLICALFFVSCGENDVLKPKPRTKPAEPCENVSWASFPARTDGYQSHQFDTITIQTFVKNSNFDSLIQTFKVLNTKRYPDDQDYTKGFSFPDEVTSQFDLLIGIGKKDWFKITEVKTEWVPRMCQSFCGYDCTITTYLVNGQREGGNISIKNPDFEYPDESFVSRRKEAKAVSDYAKDGWGDQ